MTLILHVLLVLGTCDIISYKGGSSFRVTRIIISPPLLLSVIFRAREMETKSFFFF